MTLSQVYGFEGEREQDPHLLDLKYLRASEVTVNGVCVHKNWKKYTYKIAFVLGWQNCGYPLIFNFDKDTILHF